MKIWWFVIVHLKREMLHWWWCYYVCLFGLVHYEPGHWCEARAPAAASGQEPAQYLPQFSCQSLALAARESENTRQTDSWDTENWVRGEKASPDTFYNGLHFVNITYRTAYCCFFPSWTLQLSSSIKWVKTILTDWPWTDFAINNKYSKIGKETNKKNLFQVSRLRMSSSENSWHWGGWCGPSNKPFFRVIWVLMFDVGDDPELDNF